MNPTPTAQPNDEQGEISLYDIVEFFQESWRHFLVAGIVGAVLGFGGWTFLGSYKAELILLNNTNTYGLDLVSWRTLQKSLPYLANQIMDDEKLSSQVRSAYSDMSEVKWWVKNVIPTYAISKADVKDLAGISKDLDAASTTILSLNIYSEDVSEKSSIDNVRLAAKLIKTGGAYLQIKSLLSGYEGDVIGSAADIQNQITKTEIEHAFLKERLKSLDDLYKRFPGNTGTTQQVVDPKDSGAKYLPLNTQIIAVNNDINQNKELFTRLNDRLNQITLIKTFLIEALPLAESELDGILLSKSLLLIEDKIRKDLSVSDVKSRQMLDQLRSQLLKIEARFTKGLEANTAPVSKKTGMLKSVAGGFAATFFLALMVLLGQRVWASVKANKNGPIKLERPSL